MANHKSSEKRTRQTVKKNTRNSITKKTIRTLEKKLLAAISEKNKETAPQLLKDFTKKIDKAAQKGITHVNTASRKVSRLSKQLFQALK